MVLINLDSRPEANSPTQSMCSLMEAASLGSGLSPRASPRSCWGAGAGCVSAINRFQSGYFGKENFSGALKSFHQPSASVQGPGHSRLQRALDSQGLA